MGTYLIPKAIRNPNQMHRKMVRNPPQQSTTPHTAPGPSSRPRISYKPTKQKNLKALESKTGVLPFSPQKGPTSQKVTISKKRPKSRAHEAGDPFLGYNLACANKRRRFLALGSLESCRGLRLEIGLSPLGPHHTKKKKKTIISGYFLVLMFAYLAYLYGHFRSRGTNITFMECFFVLLGLYLRPAYLDTRTEPSNTLFI